MKKMLIAATLLGAAITALIIYVGAERSYAEQDGAARLKYDEGSEEDEPVRLGAHAMG
jgi:hypothetical protein